MLIFFVILPSFFSFRLHLRSLPEAGAVERLLPVYSRFLTSHQDF
ncbi:hypothetical protein SEVIR_2G049450v4 [Setaria viridis]|uniref:Uncharacterized protein n=1 Tax=Setaria viridis TaxID=4556 RepID=A0A4U6VNZ7_SETVI|nr:hypothetical protein SEVIR_2G049450v2 [Setaria viridis]